MDYEAEDRWASRHVVRCIHNGSTFYLTRELLLTDIPERAARFNSSASAQRIADAERGRVAKLLTGEKSDAWGPAFDWQPYPAIGLPEGSNPWKTT
jgi:hypothetical protein